MSCRVWTKRSSSVLIGFVSKPMISLRTVRASPGRRQATQARCGFDRAALWLRGTDGAVTAITALGTSRLVVILTDGRGHALRHVPFALLRVTPLWVTPHPLRERNLVLVPPQPLLERLQLRVQAPRQLDVPHADEILVEVALELEHVAQVVRARKPEPAVHLGRHVVELDLPAQRAAQRRRHLGSRQVLARDGYGLPDELRPAPEDGVGALADVLGGDAGQLLVVQRVRECELTVRAALGSRAEVDQVLPVERRQQKGGRHAEVAEKLVRLTLGV